MDRVLESEGARPDREPVTIHPAVLEDAAAAGVVIPDDLDERDSYSGYLWKYLVRMVPNPLGLSLEEVRDGGALRLERKRRIQAARDAGDLDYDDDFDREG